MKTLLLIILFSSGLLFSQTQEELLNKAYEQKSYKLLNKFFENWRMNFGLISDYDYKHLLEREKDVYDIFYDFYTPKDLCRLKLADYEYLYYKNVKYVIINPQITYRILKNENYDSILRIAKKDSKDIDSVYYFDPFNELTNKGKSYGFYDDFYYNYLFEYNSIDVTINNFNPKIKDSSIVPLILNTKYLNVISNFLGDNITPLGTYSIMQTAMADSISSLKVDFLKYYIFLMPEHWGQYWEILTSPKISSIDFNSKRNLARINYSFPYHDNYTYYKKIKGKWTFVKDVFHSLW